MKFLNEYKLPFLVGLICIAMAAIFLNLTKTNPHELQLNNGSGNDLPPIEYKVMKKL